MNFLEPRVIDEEEIAKQVAEFPAAPAIEGVTPLNPGFFQIERMRLAGATKQRKE